MTKRHLLTLLMAITVGTISLFADTDTLLIYKYEIRKEIAAPIWRTTQKSIREAKDLNADYLLIHMNTYGGQVDFADSIRTALLNFHNPVIIFIDNQAISAGALISIAADSIYMRSGGSIGAATVVDQTGTQVPDKYQSFMRGMMRSTAEAHGKKPVVRNGDTTWVWHRDPAIAESMVDPKIFVAGVSDTGSVLTLTTREAIDLGFCEGEASSIEEALAAAGLENYTITEFKPSTTEKIIQLLISPVVSGLLIMVIIGGIYFELQSPGVGFPLIAALIAAILYFAPLYLEGVAANWQAIVFIAGVILLAVELFVIPGFGVAGIAGITAIIAGLTFGMIDKIVFRFGPTEEGVKEVITAFTIVMISMVASFVISIWGSSKLFSSNRFLGKLALHKTQQVNEGYVGVDSVRQHSLKGATGRAHTVLRPSGRVIIDNEIYDAVAEIGYIDRNDEIKVLHDEAGQLHVIKIS
ncbi:MAG: nodulation protein NfeD [Bacteroidales bacterium]|nr:nodulation protein NfeD [Bacteroidales bacterium]